jgi:hypothetical protein
VIAGGGTLKSGQFAAGGEHALPLWELPPAKKPVVK